jgi:hypothetical protein
VRVAWLRAERLPHGEFIPQTPHYVRVACILVPIEGFFHVRSLTPGFFPDGVIAFPRQTQINHPFNRFAFARTGRPPEANKPQSLLQGSFTFQEAIDPVQDMLRGIEIQLRYMALTGAIALAIEEPPGLLRKS